MGVREAAEIALSVVERQMFAMHPLLPPPPRALRPKQSIVLRGERRAVLPARLKFLDKPAFFTIIIPKQTKKEVGKCNSACSFLNKEIMMNGILV